MIKLSVFAEKLSDYYGATMRNQSEISSPTLKRDANSETVKTSNYDYKKHMILTQVEKKNLEDLEQLEKCQWFIEYSKLVPGNTFGELALLNDDKRKATIVTVTPCSFATLNKEDYKKILGKIE